MPKGTATYWKHDENQDDGDDVTMTIYEFLVDYMLLMTCTYLKSLFSLMYMHIYVYPTCSYVLA